MLTSKAQRDKFTGTGTDKNPQIFKINNPTNAIFKITAQNYMSQLLLYQRKMIIIFKNNWNQDLKELLNGINVDQKWLISLKLITSIIYWSRIYKGP